ncbi:MAG: lipoprotein signal peptidase [Alistipes sp.]|nr:lipoprotein signal peptidase [Alistipes sp.]
MKIKNTALLIVVLLLLDQILKIWIKTHLRIDEAIEIFPWFQLRFVENNGAAFGMQISSGGGFDWGKLLLTLFRIVMIGLLGYYIYHLSRRAKATPKGVIIGLAMILAGAAGNLIDSIFYGVIFTASTPLTVATLGEGYSSLLMGKVVDMFYFPLFQWNSVPSWLSFLVDYNNYFFGAIFNLADAYISCAVVYLLIFHYRFFSEE